MNCAAAEQFYHKNARRAMMLLQESVMKLEVVEVYCSLHDGERIRKLFDPMHVNVRDYAAGFQTFPVF